MVAQKLLQHYHVRLGELPRRGGGGGGLLHPDVNLPAPPAALCLCSLPLPTPPSAVRADVLTVRWTEMYLFMNRIAARLIVSVRT